MGDLQSDRGVLPAHLTFGRDWEPIDYSELFATNNLDRLPHQLFRQNVSPEWLTN
jgi:hypothetical protein